MKQNDFLIAFIAEGSAEQAILDVLLAHKALIYKREDMLQEEVIRCRSGEKFARNYLNKSMHKKVKIYRVLDSKREKFKLNKAYLCKVATIDNVYTRPEIEILFIIYHDDYERFCKQKLKPSDFVKKYYHDLVQVKAYNEVYDFWNDHYQELLVVLRKYRKYHRGSKEMTLADLLK